MIDVKLEAIEEHLSQNRADCLVRFAESSTLDLGRRVSVYKYFERFAQIRYSLV